MYIKTAPTYFGVTYIYIYVCVCKSNYFDVLCHISIKEHLPADGHNKWPKHVGGYADYSTKIYIYVHSRVGSVSHSENGIKFTIVLGRMHIYWAVILKWNWYKYDVMVLRQYGN